jgi:hypothetical protein
MFNHEWPLTIPLHIVKAFSGCDAHIQRVQVNQDGLKLNGTHQLLAYADDV